MEEERLKNEIKKVRESYAELQSNLDICNVNSTKLMDSNTALQDENKKLIKKLNTFEQKVEQVLEENQGLLESKRNLCKNLEKIRNDTTAQDKLTAEVLSLEEQAIQLRLELDNVKAQNAQYVQENIDLNECLVNATNEVEEKLQNFNHLNHKVQEDEKKINLLRQQITTLSNELQENSQNTNTMLETLQKNRTLTTENKAHKKELIQVLELNETLQVQAYKNEEQIQALNNNLDMSANNIEKLETLAIESSSKISELIAKLTKVEIALKETTEDRDEMKRKNNCLENQLAQLNSDLQTLNQTCKTATEQLLIALEQKRQLENELRSITDTTQNGDRLQRLKLVLLNCTITTRQALDKLNNLPEDFANIDVQDDVTNHQNEDL